MEYTKEELRMVLQELCNQIAMKKFDFTKTSVSSNNVFSILDIVGKEVPYCRVLLHLIKNNWYAFENEVLNNCCNNEKLIWSETEYPCKAPCDYYEKEGRIDILLKTENHVVVFEVKVGASDQEHQLIRYKKELENNFKGEKHHYFYLTLDGTTPSENSLVCKKCEKKCSVSIGEYKRLSFNDEIYNWVEKLVSEYEEHSLAKDFLEVLKMNRNNNREYVEVLKESVKYPMMVSSLSEAMPLLWDEIRNTFFKEIANELINNYGFNMEIETQQIYKRETWALTLKKNNSHLYFCYETNFFFRTGIEDDQWIYLDADVFNYDPNRDIFDARKPDHAFNVKYFDSSSEGLLNWYYEKDSKKRTYVIEKVASTANNFFKKKSVL